MTRVGVRQGHAIWAAVYDQAPNPLLELERRTVSPWIPNLAGLTFIDAACGTGRWARFAAERGAHVFGADFSAPMLARAVVSGRLTARRFVQADILRLPFRNALADFSVCAFAAGYLPSPAAMLAELIRITCAGGHILVTDVHPAAIASGWRRSFRRAGEAYEIRNRAHSVSGYLDFPREFGLTLVHFAEAPLGEPERSIFRACGRERTFADICRVPAIFAAMWSKA